MAFLVITFNAATAANSLIFLYCLWIILAAKLKIFVAILVHSIIIHWDEANWYFSYSKLSFKSLIIFFRTLWSWVLYFLSNTRLHMEWKTQSMLWRSWLRRPWGLNWVNIMSPKYYAKICTCTSSLKFTSCLKFFEMFLSLITLTLQVK